MSKEEAEISLKLSLEQAAVCLRRIYAPNDLSDDLYESLKQLKLIYGRAVSSDLKL